MLFPTVLMLINKSTANKEEINYQTVNTYMRCNLEKKIYSLVLHIHIMQSFIIYIHSFTNHIPLVSQNILSLNHKKEKVSNIIYILPAAAADKTDVTEFISCVEICWFQSAAGN